MIRKFEVLGMGCAACERRVVKAVSAIEGIDEVIIDLQNKSMTVTLKNAEVTDTMIIDAVVSAGYSATLLG